MARSLQQKVIIDRLKEIAKTLDGGGALTMDPDAAGGASWLNSSSFAPGLKEDAVAV